MIIAPEEPCSEATIGKALASIEARSPLAARIVKLPWAGRPSRIASVIARSSTSIGSSSRSKGPKAAVHCSAVIRPASSKARPSSAAAASL